MADERLRRFERAARDGDPIMEARAIRERLRSGTLAADRAELLAHLGHEPARIALGLAEPKAIESPEDNLAWWRAFARAGREAGVRGAIALARPHLCESIWGRDRFAGVPEEAWGALEALEDWVRAPGEARIAAFQRAITAAVEAPDPAGGIGILVSIAGLITAPSYEDAVLEFGESALLQYGRSFSHARRGLDTLLARMRKDLVPWALGERDPIATRAAEEGKHFGADPDISRSVSFSSDGRFVLSTSFAGTVTVRDAASGAIVRDFERARGQVFAAAFSPDATRVFAAGDWSPCRLLDVATGALIREIPRQGVQDVAFVDDAHVLVAADEGHLSLWDVSAPREVRVFEGHERMVTHVERAGAGRIVSASSDRTLRTWSLESGALLGTWPQPDSIDSMAVSPDGEHALAGLSDGSVRLLALSDGAERRAFTRERGSVYGVAFVPDGTRFVSVISARGTQILEWSVETGEVRRTWDYFHAITFHVAVSPDGRRFVTGDREGGLRVYDL